MAGRHRPTHRWITRPRVIIAGTGALLVGLLAGVTVWTTPVAQQSRAIPFTTSPTITSPSTSTASTTGSTPTTTPVAQPVTAPVITTQASIPPPSPATIPTPPPVVTPRPVAVPVAPAPAVAPLLTLVNQDRATAGCGPVSWSTSLESQSQAWAQHQATANVMSHSSGPTGFQWWAENAAYGYDTAQEVHAAWMSSPGHRANILNCTYTVMGAGTATGTPDRFWTEQLAQ